MAAAASPEQPAPEALAAPVPAAAAAASAASSSSSAGDDDTQASFEEVEEIKNKYVKVSRGREGAAAAVAGHCGLLAFALA
jgi:hypothetical protein